MNGQYSVYVLLSSKDNSIYIGMTSKDPRDRLLEHNQSCCKYTKGKIPWDLLYYEMNYCKYCAARRERFLKSGQGKKLLYNLKLIH